MSSKKKRIRAAPVDVLPTPSRKTNKPLLLQCAALICLTLLAYANALVTGFALDSRMLVSGDPRIREFNSSNLGLIFQHTYWWPNGEAGLYRPLTTLSYLFNYAILGNGESPAGYHLFNLLLHIANVLLVFALSRKLVARNGSFYAPVAIAALWAVHPVLTESVTNVAGRADLLAAIGVLGGFFMYIRAAEAIGAARRWWLIGVFIATAVGVFSKESAVILPGVLVVYELCLKTPTDAPGAFRLRKLVSGMFATLPPILVMLVLRAIVLARSPRAEWPYVDNPILGADFWTARLTAVEVLSRYLKLALWPWKLSADYSYSQIPLAHGTIFDWLACASIVAVIVMTAMFYRRNRPALFFAIFAFLSLLPASNLFFPIGTMMAERLLYLPLVGVAGVFLFVVQAIAARWKLSTPAVVSVLGVFVAACCARTMMRNPDWTNDRSMAEASVVTSPESFKVHRLLAAELLQSDTSRAGVARASREADRSVAILSRLPDRLSVPEPWTLAANCHLAQGNILAGDRARSEFETAVKLANRSIEIAKASRADSGYGQNTAAPLGPAAADPNRIIAAASLRLNRPDSALQSALRARAIEPDNPNTYRQIAEAYLAQDKTEEAAITLAEGAFATGSEELRGDLINLYEQTDMDRQKCAVVAGPRGPALNQNCDIVRRDLCEATARAHRPDLRKQLSCSN